MTPEDIGRYIQEFLEYARPLYEATSVYVMASAIIMIVTWLAIALVSVVVIRWVYRYAKRHWNDKDLEDSDGFISTILGAAVCGIFGALSIPAIMGYVVVLISRDYYTVKTLLDLFIRAK